MNGGRRREPLPEVARIPGPWPDARYQVRKPGDGRILAYVRVTTRGRAWCDACAAGSCPHIDRVRAWLAEQRP